VPVFQAFALHPIAEGSRRSSRIPRVPAVTVPEIDALDELARRKDLSKTAVVRQALRLLVLVDTRIARGETLFFEDELRKTKSELMVLG